MRGSSVERLIRYKHRISINWKILKLTIVRHKDSRAARNMRSRLKITSSKTDKRPVHGAGMERNVGNRRNQNYIRIAVSSHRSKLFVEDVKQHLDVLPEVAKSSTEITIDDVYVGDLDVLSTEKTNKLQQL